VFSFFQQDNIVASDKKMLTFCPILVGDYLLIPVESFDQKNLLLDSAKHLKYICSRKLVILISVFFLILTGKQKKNVRSCFYWVNEPSAEYFRVELGSQ
jgi:hypothetical protein